ncbi:Tuberous sclerosis 2-like protein [Rhodotorula sphaerocarpa]
MPPMPESSSPAANYGIAGPSRGGFIVQTHSKAVPTVATTTGDATSLDDLPPLSLPPLATVSPRDTPRDSPRDPPKKKPTLERAISVDVLPPSTVGPIETAAVDPHLPPSLVLARIAELSAQNPRLEAYVPLIRFLTTSISIFPFPPPALAAKRLSDALAAHTSASYDYRGTEEYAAPTPSPARLYLSQAHLLCPEAPPSLRTAMLDLMVACIVASLESTGGMREAEKALFWEEARRWADEAREEVDDGEGGTRWVLPDLDREALVKVLAALTRGGRDLSEVPGLVTLLCTIVIEALPVPRPPSPLFDPNLATPFIRQIRHRPARHASALALLVALHKFSAPHIYTTSTLLALRAALEVAKLREEQDIGGRDGVLDLLGAVIRYGEVTGGKAARHRSSLQPKLAPAGPSLEMTLQEGDEILREVVSCVARLIGCEGLVSVVELQEGQELRDVSISAGSPAVKTSVLPALALDIMRDLIRSPANQATKSLRSALIAPPLDNGGVRPPTPILLLVGTLRSLRKAMSEHSAEVEAVIAETGGLGVSTITSSGESRWPTMLSLGLPFLWNGIKRVMQWGDEAIDAEVLRLVEERLEAAQNAETLAANFAARNTASGASSASPAPAAAPQREVEDIPRGVSYEGWTMAIDVLERSKVHIGTWEQKHLRQWIISHDGKSGGLSVLGQEEESLAEERSSKQDRSGSGRGREGQPTSTESSGHFLRRPGVLVAFASLLRKVVRAARRSDFTGPADAVFSLLVSLAPHLSEEYAQHTLEQARAGLLCLPSHPEWLSRTQQLVDAFYVPTSQRSGSSSPKRTATPLVRAQIIHSLASIHAHVRSLPQQRQALVDRVIVPLMRTALDQETDVSILEALVGLVVEVARDLVDVVSDESAGQTTSLEDLQHLLVRLTRAPERRPKRRIVSTPTTPTSRRTATFAPLSRTDRSPAPPSRVPSLSDPRSGGDSDPSEAASVAVVGLTSIFHLCLDVSSTISAPKAISIFRDLLALMAPGYNEPPESQAEPARPPLPVRLLILQWLVRLRADASHRINWVAEVDITGAATILNRVADPNATAHEVPPPPSAPTSEDGHGEARGRRSREPSTSVPSEATTRSRSTSRLRRQLKDDRSPTRTNSLRRASATTATSTSTSPILWTVPERIPFDFGLAIAATGSKALSSFDHGRMRNWTEEEDPGTGTMKIVAADETLPPEELMPVLPVSEYLHALVHILRSDQEWELVSYILCHLPEQLSNKHFACGPRCAQQIHLLRRVLCEGLKAGDRGDRVFPATLPSGIKRAEIHAVAYQCLTALIAYRSLFTKQQQDDIVTTLLHGLSNPRDTAKPCIHALTIASFELRPSMTKLLAETVRHLQKIISSATLGVHILEFIAGVGQEPALYANFTDVDFQTVFGIALKYIQAHNERLADKPDDVEEGIEYAFSQYVMMLAYYNIAVWYLALRLPDRPKVVPFLTRRLVQANEGKPEIDEATEVALDMIARYAYSNADPRPRASQFDELISMPHSNSIPLPPPKTWIIGHGTVTVRKVRAPAWVEVTVRRPSGVVRMMWELQNIGMTSSAPESDLISALFRHRETANIMHGLHSTVRDALDALPAEESPTLHARRPRSASDAGVRSAATTPAAERLEANAVVDVVNSAARDVQQITIESGALTVDPSFFALQLSSYPHVGTTVRPLPVPSDPASQRAVTMLDTIPIVDFHKIGVLFAGPGQTHEVDILANTQGSKAYVEFIAGLGDLVRLKGSREYNIYTGGLDQENDFDGKWTYCWDDDISQMVFHIATLMPTHRETDEQCTMKKRHIGNDFVKIIWNESGREFAFDTLPGDFNFVNIVIQPHTPAGNPWIGPGMSNNTEFFKVSMQCRPGMPEIGPLGTFKMVAGSSLSSVVRQLALHSNIFAQIFLASVGFETGRPAGHSGKMHRIEYSSNWRKRLQQIKMLKQRIRDAASTSAETRPDAASPPASEPATPAPVAAPAPLDLDQAEAARQFTAWA